MDIAITTKEMLINDFCIRIYFYIIIVRLLYYLFCFSAVTACLAGKKNSFRLFCIFMELHY